MDGGFSRALTILLKLAPDTLYRDNGQDCLGIMPIALDQFSLLQQISDRSHRKRVAIQSIPHQIVRSALSFVHFSTVRRYDSPFVCALFVTAVITFIRCMFALWILFPLRLVSQTVHRHTFSYCTVQFDVICIVPIHIRMARVRRQFPI